MYIGLRVNSRSPFLYALFHFCTFYKSTKAEYNSIYRYYEVSKMEDYKKIETFIARCGNVFDEYLSSIIKNLSNTDSEYNTIEKKIANLYIENPKVKAVFYLEQAVELSEQDCRALIEILTLRNKLFDKQQETVYLRGCYDSIEYLKKASVL